MKKRAIIISFILLLVPIILGIVFYDKMPEQLPTHWGTNGEVDQYSSKLMALILLPCILFAVQGIVIFVTKNDPRKKNISESGLNIILFICPVLSIVISFVIILYGLNKPIDTSKLVGLIISLLIIVLGNFIPKQRRNYTLGIRVPWALNSDDNWNATHRFGGIVMVVGGILALIGVLLFDNILFYLIPIMIAGILPVIYSYLYYVKYEKNKEEINN